MGADLRIASYSTNKLSALFRKDSLLMTRKMQRILSEKRPNIFCAIKRGGPPFGGIPACWELAGIGGTRGTIYTFNKFTRIGFLAITISSDHRVRNRLQIHNARNLFAFYPYITHC